jgi:hypothetical protein
MSTADLSGNSGSTDPVGADPLTDPLSGPMADPLTDSSTAHTSGSTQGGAQEKAQQVAGTAAEEGKNVASTAKEEAVNVAGEAKTQARNLLSDASEELTSQSRAQQQRLAETVRTFGSDMESMSSGQSGLASDVAQQVAERARAVASHLEREPRALLGDVRDFARRRPGTFLLGALAAGVVAGRLTRAAQAAQTDSGSPTSAATGTTGNPGPTASVPTTYPVAGTTTGTAVGVPLAGTREGDVDPFAPAPAGEPGSLWADPGAPS